MSSETTACQEADPAPEPKPARAAHPIADRGLIAIAVLVVSAALARPWLQGLFAAPAVSHAATIFVAIVVQALPFLALGVTLSAMIETFMPQDLLSRLLGSNPVLAVPAAAVAGLALPGCECGSVPIARRMIDRGAAPAAALTFLLAAPAINPVVLVATAVAFPGRPQMVLARFAASALAAIVVGWLWVAVGRDDLVARRIPVRHSDQPRLAGFLAAAQHDLLQAGGFLVIGSATAAVLQTAVPRTAVTAFAGAGWLSVGILALAAVLLCVCSEADAFVAASLRPFSPTAQLAFMTVGPMVDTKLAALQWGTFGRSFAVRFVPLTFVAALGSASLIGWWLL
jgi:hypothetical protein